MCRVAKCLSVEVSHTLSEVWVSVGHAECLRREEDMVSAPIPVPVITERRGGLQILDQRFEEGLWLPQASVHLREEDRDQEEDRLPYKEEGHLPY